MTVAADEPAGFERVAILGGGLVGILMGLRLQAAGLDFVIFERADGVGGTWRRHTYPGLKIDVPSHLYAYSFWPNPDWREVFPNQAEVERYLLRVVADSGLTPHIRLGSAVRGAVYDDERGLWRLHLESGAVEIFRFVVSALGTLSQPYRPGLSGQERFRGRSWHSAEWPKDANLEGRRVALIGSAASAVQIAPQIVDTAERVYLFQRTPNWILPRPDAEESSLACGIPSSKGVASAD